MSSNRIAPLSVRLAGPVRRQLTDAAYQERRSLSNLAGVLIADGLAAREAAAAQTLRELGFTFRDEGR